MLVLDAGDSSAQASVRKLYLLPSVPCDSCRYVGTLGMQMSGMALPVPLTDVTSSATAAVNVLRKSAINPAKLQAPIWESLCAHSNRKPCECVQVLGVFSNRAATRALGVCPADPQHLSSDQHIEQSMAPDRPANALHGTDNIKASAGLLHWATSAFLVLVTGLRGHALPYQPIRWAEVANLDQHRLAPVISCQHLANTVSVLSA